MQDSNDRPLWLLDYVIVRTGTVIPQALWYPKNENEGRKHVDEAVLQMPIFYVQQDGSLGISLDDAINGRCHTLRDARTQTQFGGKTTTYIRIGVCGPSHWPRVVM